MKTKTAAASIVLLAVAMGAVVWSDLRNKSVIADEVDRVYLRAGPKPDHENKGLFEDAEMKIKRHVGRILILPKVSHEKACELIGTQLRALCWSKDQIDRHLSKMGNGNDRMDAEWQKYIDRETGEYSASVLKFKDDLSYIRRAL